MFIGLLFVISLFASSEDSFLKGVEAYNQKNYEVALENFQSALKNAPDQPDVLTNLGMTYFQLEQKGLAIAHFRRALAVRGIDSKATASLEFVFNQLPIKEISHVPLWSERMKETVLDPLSDNIFIGAFAVATFLFFWTLISYIGYRRRSLFAEETPQAPPARAFLLLLLWLGTTALLGLKIWDGQQIRATVTEKEVSVFSAPNEESVELFQIYEGFDVIVNRKQKEWVQVTYPGGLSGWIPKKHLFTTSGHSL